MKITTNIEELPKMEREKIPQNSITLEQTLKELARDDEPKVRKFVADNPNISEKLYVKLSKDPECEVRQTVATRKFLKK